MLVLVLGGIRSGKSAVAEALAPQWGRVVYLAPGRSGDAEMAARIERHRQRRDPSWQTVEEPLAVAAAVRRHGAPGTCILLDGLGTWVANLVLATAAGDGAPDGVPDPVDDQVPDPAPDQVSAPVDDLLAALAATGSHAVVVSDEVGLGLVPPNPVGRRFVDALGAANQQVAAAAQRVLLVVAGLAIDVKPVAPGAAGPGAAAPGTVAP